MPRKRQTTRRAPSAHLESLEERRLLTALIVNDTSAVDTITLGVTALGGIKVILNGKETDYQPNQWDSANINSSTGADTVNVQETTVPTIVHYAANNATINVGDASGVQNIKASLNMNGVAGGPIADGTANIFINDTGDVLPRTAVLTTSGDQQIITGLAPAQITIGVIIHPLSAQASPLPGAPAGMETLDLTTGAGGDSITVSSLRASLPTGFYNAGGNDSINIGNGSLAQINSSILVWGQSNQVVESFSALKLDDSADASLAKFALSAIYPPGPGAIVYLDFQGAAIPTQRVSFRTAEISAADIDGGAGGNQFTVNAFPARTAADGVLNLNTGAGNDAVTINSTAPGTLVNVNNTGGSDAYVVTSIGPFAPTGVNGNLSFDGNPDSRQRGVQAASSLTIFGPQANGLDLPTVPVIVTAGLVQHRDQTIHYVNIDTLQLEHGDFAINQDLGLINLTLSSQPSAISFESSTSVVFNVTQHLQSLNISAGTVTLATGANIILNTNALTIAGGTLDVSDNAIQIHYTTTPFADIRKAIFAKQIFTSSADASHALGYADSADNIVPNLSANTVLVTYALSGDANLDKTVAFADLVAVAQHYGLATNANWDQGDFNQDGAVNFADLVAVAQNYGKSLSPITPPATAMLPSIAAAVAPVSKPVSASASAKQPAKPRRR